MVNGEEKEKLVVQAVEAINLRFATDWNFCRYKVYIQSNGKLMISNQVPFDEMVFPH